MTLSIIELPIRPADVRIARLAATAVGLSLVDAAIPMPLPGVKPGLANIVTLLVLFRYGFATAAWVTALRIFAGALLLGQFLAPGFFLSLSGGICSLSALWLGQYLPRRFFGPVSLSLLASAAHMGGQVLLARLWLIPHDGLFRLVPVLGLSAWVFGIVNGLVVCRLLADEALGAKPAGGGRA
jgi:heptaprenyl diphosphate synthase